ncbi:Uncharacterized protein GBIM_01721 [Gryllus bimaculatus]|nr:Uncharacterized protein GBIM_01721 [Gryllus bimaculatus]
MQVQQIQRLGVRGRASSECVVLPSGASHCSRRGRRGRRRGRRGARRGRRRARRRLLGAGAGGADSAASCAYLASIESLDDASDDDEDAAAAARAHRAAAAGSHGSGDSGRCSPGRAGAALPYAQRVVAEVLDSERVYVRDLRQVVESHSCRETYLALIVPVPVPVPISMPMPMPMPMPVYMPVPDVSVDNSVLHCYSKTFSSKLCDVQLGLKYVIHSPALFHTRST